MRPTIVLVHGAFAESASGDQVIDRLLDAGHPVIAVANPLRGLASDAQLVSDHVRAVDGPVVLVAHSYGGAVITNVDREAGDIVGLVYVNGFAPEPGENCFGLAGMFPGSMVGEATVRPVPRSDGTTDLYIAPDSFHDVFCADVSAPRAARMAITQRPATQEALVEPSGDHPLWKDVPSWFLIGEEDRIVPAALQRFEADCAGARRTLDIAGASHAAAVSQPGAVAELILEAARLPMAAEPDHASITEDKELMLMAIDSTVASSQPARCAPPPESHASA
jgi:pimeloyl-ACP methyl ester carboxylesterase